MILLRERLWSGVYFPGEHLVNRCVTLNSRLCNTKLSLVMDAAMEAAFSALDAAFHDSG